MARKNQPEGEEMNTPETAEASAHSGSCKFKNNAKEVMHPVLGKITPEHLKNAKVIAAIQKLDKKGETKDFFKTMIEQA